MEKKKYYLEFHLDNGEMVIHNIEIDDNKNGEEDMIEYINENYMPKNNEVCKFVGDKEKNIFVNMLKVCSIKVVEK